MQLETLGFNAPGTADVEQARATLLSTEGATCVAVRNGETVISCERGFEGWSVADKVVGKAPALLYVQLKPAAIFATAMSGDARDVLLSHGIACACDDLVPYIVNRKGDGQCPMDASVVGISDPLEGERAIRETVRRMAASRG